MNEEEVQIDLMTLLHYILRKWRSIIVMMLVLAVAANLYSVKKSMAEVAAGKAQGKSTKKAIEEIKTALTDDEIEQVELAYGMYSYNAEIYRDNEQYLENSAVMQLSPNEIPTEMLSYQVKKDAAEEELVNIFAMYENALLDEDTCTAVTAVFGEKYANTSVRELIRVEDTLHTSYTDVMMTQNMNSGILNIRIYAMNQEQCGQIAEIIKDRMQVYTQQLQLTFGQFIVNPVAEQYYMSSDNEINDQKSAAINAVDSAYAAMKDASAGLTEDQKIYYDLLVKPVEEENANATEQAAITATTLPAVQYVNIKYILIGLLAGMFLAVCYHAVVYIMTGTVKDVDEVKTVTMLPVFGSVLKSEKHYRYNIVDRWIDSLFNNGKKEDNELLLERIGHEIAMLAEQKNNKHLLLVFQNDEPEMKKQAERLMAKLQECGLDVAGTDGLLTDNTEVLKQLENTDGVVLIEQLMKSDRNQIRDAIELCRRCQAEVLGSVVIGSDCY